jgi:HIV Tat-specific factor 1
VSKRRALRIVVVEGMFDPLDSLTNPQFFEELEKDIAEEFEKCGPLEKITVFSNNPKGVVIVKFATAFAAQECVRLMDGRYFGGKKLRSMFWDGVTNYTCGPATASDQQSDADEQRLEEFGNWLEQEQEELPEEFRLRTE